MASLAHFLCRLGAAVLFAAPAHAAESARGNVVIVMPDDVSFGDFSLYGGDAPRTPHIDGLAGSSVRLTNFHVSPTCSPTRAALMTGCYNGATGVWHTVMGRYFLRPDEVTMPEVLRVNGYRTALFGKWHLGDSYPLRPEDRGFEHVVMYRGGGADQQHNHWGNRNTPPAWLSEAYESWWREISVRAADYVRPILGSDAQSETCLYSHDWHADERVPFNHTMIANGAGGNGFNAVEFARASSYRFELRRWPREIEAETTATSALRVPLRENKNNQPITGVALPIHSARLRVWQGDKVYADETRLLAREADGVTFEVSLPAGPACVQTCFFDAAGKEICGAYYTYVTGTFQAH